VAAATIIIWEWSLHMLKHRHCKNCVSYYAHRFRSTSHHLSAYSVVSTVA